MESLQLSVDFDVPHDSYNLTVPSRMDLAVLSLNESVSIVCQYGFNFQMKKKSMFTCYLTHSHPSKGLSD